MEKYSLQCKYAAQVDKNWEREDSYSNFGDDSYSYSEKVVVTGFKALRPPSNLWIKPTRSSSLLINILEEFIEVPNSLKEIAEAVKESEFIFSLEEGWDDGRAKTISKDVWRLSVKFLLNYAREIFNASGQSIACPEINPCPDGSIDLSWRTPKARLLINIREVESKGILAYFYGDLRGDNMQIKGNVPSENIAEHLMVWMKNLII
ncbi:hypothetical protein [Chitinophaga sp. 22620]|uniref:hypothetical protein n=1 Tax=Chitinophaga sp. 22620 TaxID=3453952 RepID=UPI003F82D99C